MYAICEEGWDGYRDKRVRLSVGNRFIFGYGVSFSGGSSDFLGFSLLILCLRSYYLNYTNFYSSLFIYSKLFRENIVKVNSIFIITLLFIVLYTLLTYSFTDSNRLFMVASPIY